MRALGGGLLIDDAAVTLTNVFVQNNQAQGAAGSAGAGGETGATGGAGGDGQNASGGGIYLASGTLSLFSDTFSSNSPVAAREAKAARVAARAPRVLQASPADGGTGGNGGTAAGGAHLRGGRRGRARERHVQLEPGRRRAGRQRRDRRQWRTRKADRKPAGRRANREVQAGPEGKVERRSAGRFYLAAGSLTLTASTFQANSATGGAGGQGGTGGPGTAEVGGSTRDLRRQRLVPGFDRLVWPAARSRWTGWQRRAWWSGRRGTGGGVYVAGGRLTVSERDSRREPGGRRAGWHWRSGRHRWLRRRLLSGLPVGDVAGHGGTGGNGGSGYGGGINVAGGTVVLLADTLNANIAQGGQGGTGGTGRLRPARRRVWREWNCHRFRWWYRWTAAGGGEARAQRRAQVATAAMEQRVRAGACTSPAEPSR